MQEREIAPLHEASQEGHMPRGGRWVAFTGLSIACIPVVAIVPGGWKIPLMHGGFPRAADGRDRGGRAQRTPGSS